MRYHRTVTATKAISLRGHGVRMARLLSPRQIAARSPNVGAHYVYALSARRNSAIYAITRRSAATLLRAHCVLGELLGILGRRGRAVRSPC